MIEADTMLVEEPKLDTPAAPEATSDAALRLGSYATQRELASKAGMRTELAQVRDGQGTGPAVVLKHMDKGLSNRRLWERYAVVENPHLPRLLDFMSLPDEDVAVLDYVPGEDLRAYVGRKGRLGAPEAARILDDVCDADAALIDAGIVHRDIKPSNVILSYEGAWLIDPGIARLMREGGPARHDTMILGSLGYASPEQVGYAQTDARSDVYSLGRLLGFMLTGVQPNDPAFLDGLHGIASVAAPLRELIDRCCSLEPSRRPADARELKRCLQLALDASGYSPSPLSERARHRLDRPSDAAPSAPNPIAQGTARRVDAQPLPGVHVDAPSRNPAAAWAVGIVAGFFGVVFSIAGFFGPSSSLPLWTNIVFGLAIGILGNLAAGYELVSRFMLRGRYAGTARPGRRCTKRLALWWGICFAVLVAATALARTLP